MHLLIVRLEVLPGLEFRERLIGGAFATVVSDADIFTFLSSVARANASL